MHWGCLSAPRARGRQGRVAIALFALLGGCVGVGAYDGPRERAREEVEDAGASPTILLRADAGAIQMRPDASTAEPPDVSDHYLAVLAVDHTSDAAVPDADEPEDDAALSTMTGDPPTSPPVCTAAIAGRDIVWSHSSTTLYAFDPVTRVVTPHGNFHYGSPFIPPPEITDLAVTHDNQLFAVSFTGFFRVDADTAEVTFLSLLPAGINFNGLTFLPAGVLDPVDETLVGATYEGGYYRIDAYSGSATRLGQYSSGFGSSGDIVSVTGAGTFCVVRRDDLPTDYLARLDPTSGAITLIGSGIGATAIFGVGYWANTLYGFTERGELLSIDIATGVGSIATATTGTSQFWGAGVTTIAPVAPVCD